MASEDGKESGDGSSPLDTTTATVPTAHTTTTTPAAPLKKDEHDFANPTLNVIGAGGGAGGLLSRKASASVLSMRTVRTGDTEGDDEVPPPLPPRPVRTHSDGNHSNNGGRPGTSHSMANAIAAGRPSLVSKPTTQLSYAGSRSFNNSDADDSASLRSYAPTLAPDADAEAESIMGDVPLKAPLRRTFADTGSASLFAPDPDLERAFAREFDDIEDIAPDGSNQDAVMRLWRGKLKHFLILSSAGKPIYSRHGSDQLITNYIGVIQTLISFYQSTSDTLRGFTAGHVRFVVVTKGPLYLVAISRLPESDAQLRAQLDALYMQILSTLTLPSMQRMFAARANYDLRRPLQGTETLLSALADGFTRGSPSTLLSALECLRLRKSHRTAIDNTLLRARTDNLLYGLLVASGKLVSVVRPKKHSLHPGDLHLIFNMLFEARGVKAGGADENWIPLCLPGFNNTGYLYMYVSFLKLCREGDEQGEGAVDDGEGDKEGLADEVAVLLISANKEAFFEMRAMRDDLVEHLRQNGFLSAIRTAVARGRPSCADIVPGMVLRHFLYKSRANVQFVMPSFPPSSPPPLTSPSPLSPSSPSPHPPDPSPPSPSAPTTSPTPSSSSSSSTYDRRRLLTLYASLHATLHAKPAPLRVIHSEAQTYVALAWMTPLFEFYGVAEAGAGRAALSAAANRAVGWVRREEERVFIIGGAVF